MQAEIIAIGDEILIGQTIDTNSTFIAAQLNAQGIKVWQKKVIADTEEAIISALETLHPETRYVFMTGGLGPTKDDITKTTLLHYFGGEMEFRKEVYEQILKLFAGFNREPKEVHRLQAYVPNTAVTIVNEEGTAPGMRFEKEGRFYFSTPGVPYETEHLVADKIVPWIVETQLEGKIYHKTLITQGLGESEIAEQLEEWEENLPVALKLAYLPSPGLVRLRLTGQSIDKQKSTALVEEGIEAMRDILGDVVFGEDASSLEEIVGLSLSKRRLTLACAESCTGGYISHLITSIPGSSEYFLGGITAYSNSLKEQLLGVKPSSIEKFGAVSEQVALEMAEGIRNKTNSDFAVATTGVAGPGGGSEEKPVGTVWIAIAGPDGSKARKFHLGSNRQRNIRRGALTSLGLLRKEVQKINR
jgi:nicotinamide-nucleotide amidase